MKLMWMIVVILFVFMVYIFFPRINITEHMTNKEPKIEDIIINQVKNKGFEFDTYTVNDWLKTGGKWDLNEKEPFIMINGKKVVIKDSKNVYMFEIDGREVKLTYNNKCGEIVINNYTDEFKICGEYNGNYVIQKGEKILANIDNVEKNKYKLNIKDGKQEYINIYIISFIIMNQIEKELQISLDELY